MQTLRSLTDMPAKTLKKQSSASKQAKATVEKNRTNAITPVSKNNEGLPDGWKWVRVSSLAELYRGINYTKDVASDKPTKDGLPILRANNINGELNFDDLIYVPKSLIKEEQYIRQGDIVFAMSSGSKHLVGKSAVAKSDFQGSYGAFCALLRINEGVDRNYIAYIFKGNSYRKLISEIAKGTNINNLKREHILNFEVPLPPVQIQHAIVSKIEELLSELDKGKQQLETAQQQLKVYRQAVLKWAFEGKLSELGRVGLKDDRIMDEAVKGEILQSANPKNPNSDNELPEGWKWVKVSEISDVVRGGSPRPAGDPKYYDGTIPFLKVKDITKDSSIYLNSFEYTIKEAGLKKTRQIKPNTLLLSNSGATLGVPKICMINATMNDGIAAFLNLDERSNLYLYYFWLSKTRELRNINMGAAQPNLNTDIIKEYKIPYCSFEEQSLVVQQIESRLSVCDKVEETINQSLTQAETLRQSILKKAFEGKLV